MVIGYENQASQKLWRTAAGPLNARALLMSSRIRAEPQGGEEPNLLEMAQIFGNAIQSGRGLRTFDNPGFCFRRKLFYAQSAAHQH